MVSDNRNFHYAIVASLALHALLLLAFPDLIDTARRAASIPPQIIARLMAPEPTPAPALPAQEEPEKKKPEVAKPAPRLSKPLPAIEAPVSPAPRVEPAPAPAAEPSLAESAPASPPVAAFDPKPAPAATPPQPAPDARSRDQYRLQLLEEMARGAKRRYPPRGYPPLARENNWEGSVRVAIAVAADGRTSITLKASSGHEVLDQLALESLRQAARSVPLPPALRGKDFAFDLNAIYRLED